MNKEINWRKYGYSGPDSLVRLLGLDSILFQYQWLNAKSQSINGELKIHQVMGAGGQLISGLELILGKMDPFGNMIGKDLTVDGWIGTKSGYGTRSHSNLRRFIISDYAFIPQPKNISYDDSIADITYEQALAYYNWKFRIDKFQEGDDWQQFVFPTEEEFERIKRGESIVHPAEEIEYDSPVFRMVVELIPKN